MSAIWSDWHFEPTVNHQSGLLEPAAVDPQTGYRHYTTAQIPVAQIIRRFRNLDMPLNEIHAVLAAPDLQTRNDVIASFRTCAL